MKRQWLYVGALVLGHATWSMAQAPTGTQPPTTPGQPTTTGTGAGGTGAGGAGAGGDLAKKVEVCKSCCSIWDFVGIKPGGILKVVGSTRIVQALKPFGKAILSPLGLGPTMMSKKFQESQDPTMAAAGGVAKKDAQAAAKVQALRFLAKVDCKCHPEVVDAILAALDDCNEVVRYEALKALRNTCKPDKPCTLVMKLTHHCSKCGGEGIEGDEACDCFKCQCDPKVVRRLDTLLRDRHPDGCHKERSERIRKLATVMIQECLAQYQPPPEAEKPEIKGEKKELKVPPKSETPKEKSASYDRASQRTTLLAQIRRSPQR